MMAVSRRHILKATGATALAGCACGLTGCVSTNAATGRSSFTGGVSPKDDMKLGAQEHPKMLEAFGGEYQDKRLQGYVTTLGKRLARFAEYQEFNYKFTLLNSPIVNAFALPGGYVYVSRGLLTLASNEAELAGVLAHELGHVNARHTAERIGAQQLAGFGVFASAIGASLLGLPANNIAQIGQTIATLAIQSYSRDQELESDTLGIRYMSRAGYNPDAMGTFLASLREQSQLDARAKGLPPGSVDEYNLMATHPRTADRVRLAQAQAEVAKPTNARTARKTYLKFLDGMLFGDDPSEGIVINRRFVHPGMRFEFTAPEGFRLQNTPDKVVASDRGGAAAVFDIAKASSTRDMGAYLQREWARKATLRGIENVTVNGLRGATAATAGQTRGGTVDIRLVALERNSTSVFRLMFISPRNRTAALDEQFRRMTWSFRRISAAQARAIKPLHIRIRPAKAGDRLSRLAASLPYGPLNEEWFRVLNDLAPGAPLPRGRLIKTFGA
jgi:predicted Zn-dependent protease